MSLDIFLRFENTFTLNKTYLAITSWNFNLIAHLNLYLFFNQSLRNNIFWYFRRLSQSHHRYRVTCFLQVPRKVANSVGSLKVPNIARGELAFTWHDGLVCFEDVVRFCENLAYGAYGLLFGYRNKINRPEDTLTLY